VRAGSRGVRLQKSRPFPPHFSPTPRAPMSQPAVVARTCPHKQDYCSVAPTSLIPQAYIDRVLAIALEGADDLPTLTGVTFEGQDKPAVMSLSRVWKPKRGAGGGAGDGDGPVEADTLPCRAVHFEARGGTELLQCTVCDRLFTSVFRYSGHACGEPVVATVVARGCALAVGRAPYSAPLPVVDLPAATNAATVTGLLRGWDRPVARDKEHLDATVVRLHPVVRGGRGRWRQDQVQCHHRPPAPADTSRRWWGACV
jgi:hypothetical protein